MVENCCYEKYFTFLFKDRKNGKKQKKKSFASLLCLYCVRAIDHNQVFEDKVEVEIK